MYKIIMALSLLACSVAYSDLVGISDTGVYIRNGVGAPKVIENKKSKVNFIESSNLQGNDFKFSKSPIAIL